RSPINKDIIRAGGIGPPYPSTERTLACIRYPGFRLIPASFVVKDDRLRDPLIDAELMEPGRAAALDGRLLIGRQIVACQDRVGLLLNFPAERLVRHR